MGKWSIPFFTKDPEAGHTTKAMVATDKTGAVTDFIYGLEHDRDGQSNHGHVWNLGPYTDDDSIGGRDAKVPEPKSGK